MTQYRSFSNSIAVTQYRSFSSSIVVTQYRSFITVVVQCDTVKSFSSFIAECKSSNRLLIVTH